MFHVFALHIIKHIIYLVPIDVSSKLIIEIHQSFVQNEKSGFFLGGVPNFFGKTINW